ncbi:unnamed protein product [Rhizoctonia solani]|uniref:PQ-loop repeat-containing protein 1 n=1 Tax=Rhizoctonia solani TaxID=456999 RepID=A0A8H2ZZU8_9AGAM|nr:PQ-loop repeat-containing protein 1 [Rhizoctonia solani]QRW25711.1 PQ-loop repeat-containing protein 1 [Rhizoctonia solani]CAE6343361.1 unnamed protein product [Rhizoctonia solani]
MDQPTGCKPHHDLFTLVLSSGLITGLILSYVPQHSIIIRNKTSEGLSPWYLLLGSTSAAAGFINVLTLQWGLVRCCKHITAGACLESVLGVIQVFFQWFMFSGIFVLYLLYFPAHLKFVTIKPQPHPGHAPECDCETCELALKGEYIESTSEWKMSVVLACIVAAHFLISLFTTFFVVLNDDRDLGDNTTPPSRRVTAWATFLGLSSTILCLVQYTPQLYRTWHAKTVGSLSIPMMCIQTPGAVLMVLSIALRQEPSPVEGTDWTSWATYAAAGIMQGMLLLMCLRWKRRQTKLGIDDYGRPIAANGQDERAPLLGPN